MTSCLNLIAFFNCKIRKNKNKKETNERAVRLILKAKIRWKVARDKSRDCLSNGGRENCASAGLMMMKMNEQISSKWNGKRSDNRRAIPQETLLVRLDRPDLAWFSARYGPSPFCDMLLVRITKRWWHLDDSKFGCGCVVESCDDASPTWSFDLGRCPATRNALWSARLKCGLSGDCTCSAVMQFDDRNGSTNQNKWSVYGFRIRVGQTKISIWFDSTA